MHNYNTDQFGGAISKEFEIEKLTSQLNYPVEVIMKAIQEVGYDAEDVEEYIRDRDNRS